MTPSENIYRSDADVVDGLDIRDMMEDDKYDIYDADDDRQPTMQEEYHDLYDGDDYIGDMYLDVVDYPEDWGQNGVRCCCYTCWTCQLRILKIKYYFDEFETREIQALLKAGQEEIPRAKMRGDLEDVKVWEDIVRSSAKEILRRYKDDE